MIRLNNLNANGDLFVHKLEKYFAQQTLNVTIVDVAMVLYFTVLGAKSTFRTLFSFYKSFNSSETTFNNRFCLHFVLYQKSTWVLRMPLFLLKRLQTFRIKNAKQMYDNAANLQGGPPPLQLL